MPVSMALSDLITQVRTYSDTINNRHTTDDQITVFLNSEIAQLYHVLTEAYASDYYFTQYQFTTVPNQQDYPLPSDFYKLIGLDTQRDPLHWISLRKFMFRERNLQNNLLPYIYGSNIKYRPLGSNIRLSPLPAAALTLQLYYYPTCPVLVNSTDTFAFEDYAHVKLVVLGASVSVLEREQSDTSDLKQDYKDLLADITAAVENRDANEADRVVDAQSIAAQELLPWWWS